jgi:hypothetical protein
MTRSAGPRLAPLDDGALAGRGPVQLALTNARLQAHATPSGVTDVVVWGSGRAGSVRFVPPLPSNTHVRVTPNRIDYDWGEGRLSIAAAPHEPTIVLRGAGSVPALRVVAGRRPPPGFESPAALRPLPDGWRVASDWAELVVRAPGGAVGARGALTLGPGCRAVIAAGADGDEAAAAAAAAAADPDAAERALAAAHAELSDVLRLPDPELQSLFLHGLHAARSARKTLAGGAFAGFAAGVGYAMPPRTYFRDGYWTLQVLLPLWPELAREQLLLLSSGVRPDGEAPSGVIVASPAGERTWRARRAADPSLAADHPRDGEWWADHTDSPLYYALLACEVAAWTRDPDLFAVEVGGVTIGERVAAVLAHAAGTVDATGLPVKPAHDRDWADNVFRGGHVTYDVGLYHGALVRVAEAIAASDPGRAADYRARAAAVRAGARERLWCEERGHFVEFREPGGRAETHLAIDTLTALRYGLAEDAQAARVLGAMRARLETRHNADQPYGDWGVMSVFPPYASWVRRRGKSRFAYRYHNGSDWPYWDGVYAEARMARGLAGWRYPLTRWWSHGLDRGWATPVEYAAPPWGAGSPANAWSSMPAAAMLLGGFGLTPTGAVRAPPWGESVLQRRGPDGRRQRVAVSRGAAGVGDLRLEVDHG